MTIGIILVLLSVAFPFLIHLAIKLHQDHISRKISRDYHKSLNEKYSQSDREEEELLELIWDLDVEAEHYVHYHNTLQ